VQRTPNEDTSFSSAITFPLEPSGAVRPN